MQSITRSLLLLTVAVLSFAFVTCWYQPASARFVFQDDELRLRSIVERLYADYANKDLNAYFSHWDVKSKLLESRRELLRRSFLRLEKLELKKLSVKRIKVESETAEVRIVVEMDFIRLGEFALQHQTLNRLIVCGQESGNWKVLSDIGVEVELAAKLAAAKSDEERSALMAADAGWSPQTLAESLPTQASQLAARGEFNQAIALCQLMKRLSEQGDDQRLPARALNLIGDFQMDRGDLVSSLGAYRQSLEILKGINYTEGIAALQNSLGNVLATMGDYNAAIAAFQQSLASGGVTPTGKARVLNNIAAAYRSTGNYARALMYVNQSIELSRSMNSDSQQAAGLNTLATINLAQGDPALAEQHFRESLDLYQKSNEKKGLADTLGNLGYVLVQKGDYDEALKLHQRSLDLRLAQRDKPGQAISLANIGDIYKRRRLYEQALDYHRRSLALREEVGAKDKIAFALNTIASVYFEQENFQQALPLLQRAAPLAKQSGNLELSYRINDNTGQVLYALNRVTEARRAFDEAIAIIEEIRLQVAGDEQQQERYFESKTSPYLGATLLCLDEQKPAEALSYAERAKSRVLLDVLQQGRADITKSMTSTERDREKFLNDDIISLNSQLYRASLGRSPDVARIGQLTAQLEKARRDREIFQTGLYAAHPELKTQRGQTPQFDLNAVAGTLLDAQTALLEYVVAMDKTYLFVITQGAGKNAAPILRSYQTTIAADKLNGMVESFRRQLADHDLTFSTSARQLYDALLKPAAEQLLGKTKLVIVRESGLWELPFQALKNDAGRYLVEEFAISYAPSLMALTEMSKLQARRKNYKSKSELFALGNPTFGHGSNSDGARDNVKLSNLPSAETEVIQLGRLYGSPVYTGIEATEQRFKSEASNADVLHLATHGVLNNASPMYSQIVLAQVKDGEKSSEDGLLEAWEVMKLDLRAKLVVLSACETGRGRIGAGEGVIGLTWAFFVAGAPTTVVSQWKVDAESTAELMQSFHRELRLPKPDRDTAEALRTAELKLLRNPKYRHPFYWASFSVVGASR